ncbi:MAG: hypothetical protein IH790_09595 [Acidobacteria bacterium]|nr:hypothetical protein [Acidobacteriota bacterium]
MRQAFNKVLGIFLIVFVCSLGLPLELLAQVYNPRGKRDPFIDLQELFRQEQPRVFIPELPPLSERPLGLVGLAISEVTVTGVAMAEDNRVVILKGVDSFTYLAREENKLFDGYVFEISNEEVVFIQEVLDPRGSRETLRVVKRLFTEED